MNYTNSFNSSGSVPVVVKVKSIISPVKVLSFIYSNNLIWSYKTLADFSLVKAGLFKNSET